MASKRWIFPVLGVGAAAVAISAAGAIGWSGFEDGPTEPVSPFAQPEAEYEIQAQHGTVPSLDSLPDEVASQLTRSGYASSPRTMTEAECVAARPRMEAIAQLAASRVEELDSDSDRERLAAALKESHAWFDAGCPPHEKLGIYPADDGSGTMNILIDF